MISFVLHNRNLYLFKKLIYNFKFKTKAKEFCSNVHSVYKIEIAMFHSLNLSFLT